MAGDDGKKLPKSLIRIIDVTMRLLQGEKIASADAANLYGVNKRTIYRDLQIIRENPIFNANYQIEIDPVQKRHFVIDDGKISTKEVLAIIQIIMGSRALSKVELDEIVGHLRKLVITEDQPKVDRLLKLDYIPVKSNGKLLDYIEDFTRLIESRTEIEFTYQGSMPNSDIHRLRQGVPLSLYFSNFYFYVLIFSQTKGARVCRLDRILSYKELDTSVNVPR